MANKNLHDKLRNETPLPDHLQWDQINEGIYSKMDYKKQQNRFSKFKKFIGIVLILLLMCFISGLYHYQEDLAVPNELFTENDFGISEPQSTVNAENFSSAKPNSTNTITQEPLVKNNQAKEESEEFLETPSSQTISSVESTSSSNKVTAGMIDSEEQKTIAFQENTISSSNNYKPVKNKSITISNNINPSQFDNLQNNIDEKIFVAQPEIKEVSNEPNMNVQENHLSETKTAKKNNNSNNSLLHHTHQEHVMNNSPIYQDRQSQLKTNNKTSTSNTTKANEGIKIKTFNTSLLEKAYVLEILQDFQALDFPFEDPIVISKKNPSYSKVNLSIQAGTALMPSNYSGSDLSDAKRNFESPAFGKSLKLKLNYKLNHSISIQTGITYQSLTQKFDYYHEKDTLVNRNIVTRNVFTNVISETGNSIMIPAVKWQKVVHYNRTNLLSIPLIVSKHFALNRKFEAQIGLGTNFTIIGNSKGRTIGESTIDDQDFEVINFDNDLYKFSSTFSWILNANIAYKLTPKMTIGIGLESTKFAQNVSLVDGEIFRPFILDGSLQLNYNF